MERTIRYLLEGISDENKLRIIGIVRSERWKHEIAKTLTTDEAKMQAVRKMDPERPYGADIAESMTSDRLKLQIMDELTRGLDRVAESIDDDEIKLRAMKKIDNEFERVRVAITLKTEDALLSAMEQFPDDLDLNKVKILEKIKERRIEGINKLSSIKTKMEYIRSLSGGDRIKALQEVEGLSFHDKFEIISGLDVDDKMEALKTVKFLLKEDKERIIETLPRERREEASKLVVGLEFDKNYVSEISGEHFGKCEKIWNIENVDERISAMKTADITGKDIATIILYSIDGDENKIKALNELGERLASYKALEAEIVLSLNSDEEKFKRVREYGFGIRSDIISTIKNEGMLLELIEAEGYLEESERFDVAIAINNDKIKTRILDYVESIDRRVTIICSIEADDKKIELLNENNNLEIKYKADIIKSVKDVDKKIEAMLKVDELDIKTTAEIVASIENESEIIELLKSNRIDSNIWTCLRNEKMKPPEFILRHIELFINNDYPEEQNVDNKRNIMLSMYEKNNDVVYNIDFRILDEKYIKALGEEKINLISCYRDVQKRVLELSDNELNIFSKCIDRFIEDNKTDEWTAVAEVILGNIGEYSELIENIGELNNLSTEDIDVLTRIMQNENWCSITSMEEARRYDEIRINKCNEIMNSSESSIEEKRLALLQKIYGHDIEYAKTIIEKFGEDIENIDDSDVKDYVRSLKLICDLDDETAIREIYDSCDTVEINRLEIERELKNEYGKKFNEGLFVPQDGRLVDGMDNVYEAGTDFKMIITAIGAYSGISPDDYKEDWNRPTIASQHFCSSYIRNDMIGTAPIKNICYGFSEMKEDALMLSGSQDISSSFEDFVSEAGHHERYFTPDEQIDRTDSFNEMDFRRIQGGEKLQPSYIVVFREGGVIANMDEALKAQKQWGGLPIVIVDVDACLEEERRKVDEMLEQYDEHPSEELAKQIVQKVRNNRVTRNRFCSDIDGKIDELREVAKSADEKDKPDEKHEKHEEETHSTEEEHTSSEEQIAVKDASSEETRVTMEDWQKNYEGVKSVSEKNDEGNKIRAVYKRIQEVVRRKSSERQQ